MHQAQKFVLRHDFAQLSESLGTGYFLVIPGYFIASKVFRYKVSYIHLVGRITDSAFKTSNMSGKRSQILGVGVDDPLRCLCGPVMDYEIRPVDQNVAGRFYYRVSAHFRILSIRIKPLLIF